MTVPHPVQALGYIGVRADSLEDWSNYAGKTPRPPARRQGRQDGRLPHGRPQAAHHRRRLRRQGHQLLRLGSGGCRGARRSRRAARSGRREGRARLARAGRRTPRQGSDRLGDPFGNRLEIFHGAEIASRCVQAGPLDLRLSHRPARARPCGAHGRKRRQHPEAAAVLSGRARLPPDRLSTTSRSAPISCTSIRAITVSRFIRTGKNASITS